jgi:putative endonuclease
MTCQRDYGNRTKQNPKSFTAQYNISKLVYIEGFELVTEAIVREKFIKGKSRQWKVQLIESMNSEWNDLTISINF